MNKNPMKENSILEFLVIAFIYILTITAIVMFIPDKSYKECIQEPSKENINDSPSNSTATV